jgi:GT2 family glycosyltransferase
VAQQVDKSQVECIVVDDVSAGEYTEAIRYKFQKELNVSLLINDGAVGRSLSCNRGWNSASADLIAFIGEDSIPARGWFAALRQWCSKGPQIISGQTLYLTASTVDCDRAHDPSRTTSEGCPQCCAEEDLSKCRQCNHRVVPGPCSAPWIRSLERRLLSVSHAAPAINTGGYTINGDNCMVSREVLECTGGFSAFMSFGADTDLGLRASQHGYPVVVDKSATVWKMSGQYAGTWSDVSRHAFSYRHPVQAAALVPVWMNADIAGTLDEIMISSVPYVGSWCPAVNGPTSADSSVVTHGSPAAITGAFKYSLDEMINFFSDAAGIDKPAVGQFISDGIAAGMFVEKDEHASYFDICHTGNWIRSRTLYQASCLRNATFARTHWTPHQRDRHNSTPVKLWCTGRYELRVDVGTNAADQAISFNVSTPGQHNYQSNVRVTSLAPPDLEAYRDSANAVFANVPISVLKASGGCISYEFECSISEGITTGVVKTDASSECMRSTPEAEYLRFSFPARCRARSLALLQHILQGGMGDAETDARRIYQWILNNMVYLDTPLRDYMILETGMGTCLQLSRLFVNLVRLRGIPAREQCGALMSRELASAEIVTITKEYSPFVHTWAEVYIDGRGWLPVEFLVMGYGRWAATPTNVDSALRAEMCAQTPQLTEYYFGNIDPYRVYTSEYANKIPPIVACGLHEHMEVYRGLSRHFDHRIVYSVAHR